MNQEKKNALSSIIFYAIFLLIIIVINTSGKFESTENIISLDISSIILLAILNVILLVINGIKAYVMKKQTKLSFAIHLIVFVIWIVYYNL